MIIIDKIEKDKFMQYTIKNIIDTVCTSIYRSKKWGRSNQSIFVGYCITMGSGLVMMDEPGIPYIEKMREYDLKTFNEKFDMIESLCRAGDRNPEIIANHTNYYTVIDQYLAQSVKYIEKLRIEDVSFNIRNKTLIKEHWEFLAEFLKSVLKMKDRYIKQINKIYDEMVYDIIEYTFTKDISL